MDDPSKLLAIGEAAQRLGVPVSRLRYWADHDYVLSIRTPTKRRYFTLEAIDALAAEMMPLGTALPNDTGEAEGRAGMYKRKVAEIIREEGEG